MNDPNLNLIADMRKFLGGLLLNDDHDWTVVNNLISRADAVLKAKLPPLELSPQAVTAILDIMARPPEVNENLRKTLASVAVESVSPQGTKLPQCMGHFNNGMGITRCKKLYGHFGDCDFGFNAEDA